MIRSIQQNSSTTLTTPLSNPEAEAVVVEFYSTACALVKE